MNTKPHKPLAWMHEDGRIVRAETMEHARRHGGAMLSSLADYTIPLYGPDALTAEREQWKRIAAAAQAVTEGAEDTGDFLVPSHLMASLALALDEGPN